MTPDSTTRGAQYLAIASLGLLAGLITTGGSLVMRLLLLLAPLALVGLMWMLKAPQVLGFTLLPIMYSNLEGVVGIFTRLQTATFMILLTAVFYGLTFLQGNLKLRLGAPARVFILFFVIVVPVASLLPGRNDVEYQAWLKTIIYGLDAFMLVQVLVVSPRRFEILIRILTWTGVALAMINIVEFMDRSIISLSPVPGRSAGLHLNSNPSAAAILACYILSYLIPQRFEMIFRLIMFAGIYTTFSRATLIFFFAFLLFHEIVIQKMTFRRIAISLLMLASVATFISNRELLIAFSRNENVEKADSRLSAMTSGNFDDDSARQRQRVIFVQLDRFTEHPFLGGGAGAASGEDSPHNQFLLVMVEHGLLGLLIFLAFLATALQRILMMPSGNPRNILLSLYLFEILNMFVLHNHFDHRFFMVIFALLCVGPEVYDPRETAGTPRLPLRGLPVRPQASPHRVLPAPRSLKPPVLAVAHGPRDLAVDDDSAAPGAGRNA